MTMLSRSALEELLELHEGPCFSFFLTTHRCGRETQQDRAQLKRLLRKAELHLTETGMDADGRREFLAPITALLGENGFWNQQLEGLALYVAPGFLRFLEVESELEERLEVGGRFAVAPLIAALPPAERFYLLALSRKAARILEVTPAEVRRLEIPDLRQSTEAALNLDPYEAQLQVHSVGPGGRGRQPGVVHGHGDYSQERRKENDLALCRRIAKIVDQYLDTRIPLVLASVGELVPLYREVSNGVLLLDPVVPGNPDHLPDRELAEKGWELLHKQAKESRLRALNRYREVGPQQAPTDEPTTVVAAACQGRVDTLFMVPGGRLRGHYKPEDGQVDILSSEESRGEDLVDLAVARTLAQGGEVVAVPSGALAGTGPVAAILRY